MHIQSTRTAVSRKMDKKPLTQNGLSMIELLVALALSCFLLLGVSQLFIDSRYNYFFQQGQASNQENSRFTLLLLEQQLVKAGYRRLADTPMESAFPKADPAGGCGAFIAGQVITPATGDRGICLRYQAATVGESDCLGNLIPGTPGKSFDKVPSDITKTYRITFTPGTGKSAGSLQCGGQELVAGIEDINISYGVGPKGKRSVESFTETPTADQVVRGVRFSVLASSGEADLRKGVGEGVDSKAKADWITYYGGNKAALDAKEHGQLLLIGQGAQTLRNMMP
ncbi:type IV pilus assembly protein PilW [Pseudomonas peli]|uniref:Type IV pilus assembly protein PilW n=2 Tax=Pseudomonas peli TaxID=592361 RepID=A0AB37Z5A6_9PSED|nr:type IV pilus assembly protein PilW [Pseudomonas peli]